MNKIIAFEISLLIALSASYFLFFSKPVISSPKPTPTPSPSPSSTPTPKPTPTDTPEPTPKPTLAPTPVAVPKYTSQQVNGFIDRFAGQHAVDPNVLRYIAICESGFNPSAINGPYYGLFQFGEITWENLRVEIGENPQPSLRLDAEEATQTAAYAISKGKIGIWPNCHP